MLNKYVLLECILILILYLGLWMFILIKGKYFNIEVLIFWLILVFVSLNFLLFFLVDILNVLLFLFISFIVLLVIFFKLFL